MFRLRAPRKRFDARSTDGPAVGKRAGIYSRERAASTPKTGKKPGISTDFADSSGISQADFVRRTQESGRAAELCHNRPPFSHMEAGFCRKSGVDGGHFTPETGKGESHEFDAAQGLVA
jgi:hypothetical protein